MIDVAAVDVFCGAGGLSYGLASQGIDVRVGFDINPACAYPYAANNNGAFVLLDAATLKAGHLTGHWKGAAVRLLAGCAPCQAFSSYTQARRMSEDDRWGLVDHFVDLACTAMPELVTMENVPGLLTHRRFDRCVKRLARRGYSVSATVVDSASYGAPQMRRRLVLLASRLGSLSLVSPAKFRAKRKTVRDAIGALEPLKAGQMLPNDPLHAASRLSPLNLERIRHSKPGGTWKDWPTALRAECHAKTSGRKYTSVNGRMEWDKVAPTITTLAYNYGSGRFGHPDQDRALSLREAALLQTFPRRYTFFDAGERINIRAVGL